MSGLLRLSLDDLINGAIDRLAHPWTPDPDPPLAVIELEAGRLPSDELTRITDRLARSELVTIGVWRNPVVPPPHHLREALGHLSVTLSAYPHSGRECMVGEVDTGIEHLVAAHEQHPRAFRILDTTLRLASSLPVAEALLAESFAYATLLAGGEHHAWLAATAATRPPAPTSVAQSVQIRRASDHLFVTLDRTERRNAFGAQLRHEFVGALELADADPSIKRIIVDGKGSCFCAGGDLGEFGSTRDQARSHLIRTTGGPARLIHFMASRCEFRLHGACVGAGIELAALAGTVIARDDATFRLPELAMGLIPGAGGTAGVTARIGRWRAFGMCATGRRIDCATALHWGLVDRVLSRDEFARLSDG